MGVTSDRNDPGLTQVDPTTGMQETYLVLSEEERAKGYVRPVRTSYIHVGPPGPTYELRDLTSEEVERYHGLGYVKYEEYPQDEEGHALGRFWTQEKLDKVGKGCGAVTTMAMSIAQTYARDPGYYGGTYCASCYSHFPVGLDGEFVWTQPRKDIPLGTQERVGT